MYKKVLAANKTMFSNLKTTTTKVKSNYMPAIWLIIGVVISVIAFIYRKKIIDFFYKNNTLITTPPPIEQLNKFAVIDANVKGSQEVAYLQSQLRQKGYSVSISGNADAETMGALAKEGYVPNPPLALVSVLVKTGLNK